MEQSEQAQKTNLSTPICKSESVNDSERYLKKLCEHSFLSLWSYPSIHRDEGHVKQGGDGQEICDMLVVFENHVIIFSDKHCKFNDSGNLEIDWSRWYRAAIKDGAKQVWGAERWIKKFPQRVFLDRKCTQPFPIPLPDATTAQFHRIIVAHGASERCKRELGGSGSLMMVGSAIDALSNGITGGGRPFTISQIDETKGFVHIFDDTTLDIVLQTLDTISDFVAYLSKKEAFVTSGRLLGATGEEELLAHYLVTMNDEQEHDFVFPSENAIVSFGEGGWEQFCRNPQRLSQIQANKISYAWDELIERFSRHILAGTQYRATHPGIESEEAVRFLAREHRTGRRGLMLAFASLIEGTPANKRGVRIARSFYVDDIFYVFMLFPHLAGWSYEKYREIRGKHLEQYCLVAKRKIPDAQHIVGIAIESGMSENSSEDLIYLDARDWTEEMEQDAARIQQELNLLNNVRTLQGRVSEYPDIPPVIPVPIQSHNVPYRAAYKVGRNELCPCGSGRKYKQCHG